MLVIFRNTLDTKKVERTFNIVWGDFLFLYSQFYEVIILESTYVISEKKMQVYL